MSNSIGSGIDVAGIVDGLMSVQQQDLARLNKKKTGLQHQQTAYHKLRDLLKDFSKNMDNLNSILNRNIFKAQSSNESVISASLNSQKPSPGTYAIVVNHLAQAHQVATDAYTNQDQPLQINGSLEITTNDASFTLQITETDTLESIRDHINTSLNNKGVSASILKTSNSSGQDEFRLVLGANSTGTANRVILSGNALENIPFTTEIQAAQDADFTINNFQVTRSSNVISDVLTGVTFQLNADIGSATVNISSDVSNQQTVITDSLKTMVDSYNNLIDSLAKNQSLSSLRDSTYSIIKMNLKNTMSQMTDNDNLNSLLSLGIKFADAELKTNDNGVEYAVEGKLKIDTKILQEKLQNNLSDVRSFFSGVGSNFSSSVKFAISNIETRNIFNREQLIGKETSLIDHRMLREESRLDEMRKNLTIKYAALDSFISRYQQMGSFLDQQIASLNPTKGK